MTGAAMLPSTAAVCSAGKEAFLDAASWLLPPALACFAAGQYARRVWLGLAGVVAAMAIMYATLVHFAGFNADVLFGLIVYLGPWACGVTLGAALNRAAQQAAAAERERVLGERARETGAMAERLRITQDLHDSLTHSLTAMVVQADLANDLLKADPAAARQALGRVSSRGREVLAEADQVIRAARDPGSAATVRTLVDEARALGLEVEIDEPLAEVPPALGSVVTAIVREGLTNALRHSAARRVRLGCVSDGAQLRLQIVNDDLGEVNRRAQVGAHGGLGLIGIRERVAAHGGALEIVHQPVSTLTVCLPLPGGPA